MQHQDDDKRGLSMKILDYMTITEAAEVIRLKALEIKDKMKVTEQEAYNMIVTDIEKYLYKNK